MMLEIQVMAWDRQNCSRVKPINWIPTLPPDNWILNDNIDTGYTIVNKQ
jgi:hypothetical protein